MKTKPGVPNPLLIDVRKGSVIEVVLRDVLALTKVNYNSCIFADGVPVTLRFANSVGGILTAGSPGSIPSLDRLLSVLSPPTRETTAAVIRLVEDDYASPAKRLFLMIAWTPQLPSTTCVMP